MTRNRHGQAMVEAAGAVWVLVLTFFCLYALFLLAIDKIRSLDTAHHLARAQGVGITGREVIVIARCFGRVGIPQVGMRGTGTGPRVGEIVFTYVPRALGQPTRLWKSEMRVAQPDREFLDRSWPGASNDPSGDFLTLQEEIAQAALKARVNQDAVLDAAADFLATREAERP